MALQTYITSIGSASTIANLGTLDDAVVGAQASLLSGGTAISGTGSTQSVTVFGSVYGTSSGISLSGVGSIGDTVTIAADGQMSGDGSAILVDSNFCTVNNAGVLTGVNWGVFVISDGPGHAIIFNSGSILAGSGIGLDGTGPVDILNTGRIEASNNVLSSNPTTIANVRNTGVMIGDLNFGDMNDTLFNRGTIDGTIRMDGGDDRVTIRGDYDGIIVLGAGNDDYDRARARQRHPGARR